MAEQPPLFRIHVVGYSANDRDFPILNLVLDPRVAGYQVPKDLSACPDKRYPNHVFTGAQPIAGDQRVRHVWEILPSPWVPFTRYDDDLGPVQGRRRSVKNEGQVAIRGADKQVTYEAREGSAIVYTELEETWSIKVDEDGNSLFPIRDRDFYDPSRGPVQERRQLFVPTGEEEGSLENVNGVITQTSYEPYNEFLSVKIVQTYKVDGPQLIGKATNNEGQLVTVTTQRKGSKDYVAPAPTATRTVEASREDAESIVERIVDTPEVFGAEVFRKTREDLTPQKFKAAQEDITLEQTVEGAAQTPTLSVGEFVKSEQQVNKFLKRISTTSRNVQSSTILSEKILSQDGQIGTRTLTLASGNQSFSPSATLIDASVESLGDGRTVKSETVVGEVFQNNVVSTEIPDLLPNKFKTEVPTTVIEKTEEIDGSEDFENPISKEELEVGEISKRIEKVTKFIKRTRSVKRDDVDEAEIVGSEIFTSELGGGFAEIEETYSKTKPTLENKLLLETVSLETENIGRGEYVTRNVKLKEGIKKLYGQEYDEFFDIEIPYEQEIIESYDDVPSDVISEKSELVPQNVKQTLKRKFSKDVIKGKLLEKFWSIPSIVNVSLPDTLINIKPVVTKSVNGGYQETDLSLGNGQISTLVSGGYYSAIVNIQYEIEEGYSGPVEAYRHIFFMDGESSPVSVDAVVNKIATLGTAIYGVSTSQNPSVEKWPRTKPKKYTIIGRGGTIQTENTTVVKDGGGQVLNTTTNSGSGVVNGSIVTTETTIPPTLHRAFQIEPEEDDQIDLSQLTSNLSDDAPSIEPIKVEVEPKVLPKTDPQKFPVGAFLVSVDSEPYRFGLIKITAVVAKITSEYVP